jgi:zinc protease
MIQRMRDLRGALRALLPRHTRLALYAFAAVFLANAQASASRSIQHQVLPNGLEVLLLPEPQRRIASVQMWYRIGLPEEDAETAGYAHLLEHLMSTGTAANPDFTGAIAALGGASRSGSRQDLTYYVCDVPSSAVERVIAIEADRMRGLTLSAEAIARELEEIKIEEASSSASLISASESVADQMWELAFPGHPYGRPFRGIVAAAATPERCRTFYDRFYGPDRACLVVAGGIDPDQVLDAVTAAFGGLKPTGNPRSRLPAPSEPADLKERSRIVESTGPTWIGVGYLVPSEDSPDAMAVKLLASYLNVDIADSLAAALRQGALVAAPGVAAHLRHLEGAGLLTFVSILNQGADADRAIHQLAQAVARLTETPLSPEDFGALRDRGRVSQAMAGATVSQRATALAVGHLHGGGLETLASADSALASAGAADITRIAASHLRPERALSLRIGPSPSVTGPAGWRGASVARAAAAAPSEGSE